jgi:heme exporter protein B
MTELALVFWHTLRRDLRLACRDYREWLYPLAFFILVILLFPLAVSPEPKILKPIASGVIWVAALLASLLSLDRLFHADFFDGTLEQLLLSPFPLSILVFAKIIAHWVVTGLPLLVIAPLMGLFLHLSAETILILLAVLALGTPILSFIGAIGMALTLGVRHSGMLLALLVIPLYIPVLIFGASAVTAVQAGLAVSGQLAWLAALLLLAICLAPMVIAAALRIGVE